MPLAKAGAVQCGVLHPGHGHLRQGSAGCEPGLLSRAGGGISGNPQQCTAAAPAIRRSLTRFLLSSPECCGRRSAGDRRAGHDTVRSGIQGSPGRRAKKRCWGRASTRTTSGPGGYPRHDLRKRRPIQVPQGPGAWRSIRRRPEHLPGSRRRADRRGRARQDIKVGHLKQDWDALIPVGGVTRYLGDAICHGGGGDHRRCWKQAPRALVEVDYEECRPGYSDPCGGPWRRALPRSMPRGNILSP